MPSRLASILLTALTNQPDRRQDRQQRQHRISALPLSPPDTADARRRSCGASSSCGIRVRVARAQPARIQHDADHAGNGQHQPGQHHGADIHAEDARYAQRPRRRRHRVVGEDQPPASATPSVSRLRLPFRQRLDQRIKDDERRIDENRDADDIAGDGQRPPRLLPSHLIKL